MPLAFWCAKSLWRFVRVGRQFTPTLKGGVLLPTLRQPNPKYIKKILGTTARHMEKYGSRRMTLKELDAICRTEWMLEYRSPGKQKHAKTVL